MTEWVAKSERYGERNHRLPEQNNWHAKGTKGCGEFMRIYYLCTGNAEVRGGSDNGQNRC